VSDLVNELKARALDRRRRDVKMAGEANVGPLQGFFDWQVAAEIVRLRAAKTAALKLADERAIEAVGLRAKLVRYRKALEEIRQRIYGPANAQMWDIRQIVDAALPLTDEKST
jgi:hypothetical protein